MALNLPQVQTQALDLGTLLSIGMRMRESQRQQQQYREEAQMKREQLDISKGSLEARMSEIEAQRKARKLDADKFAFQQEQYQTQRKELEAGRLALADMINMNADDEVDKLLKSRGVPTSEDLFELGEKYAGDIDKITWIRDRSAALAEHAKTGAAEYMKEVFGQDDTAAYFGFDKPPMDFPKIDNDGYVILGKDGKPEKHFWTKPDGTDMTPAEKNARAYGVAMEQINRAYMGGSVITHNAEAAAMKLAPDDSTREFIHMMALKSRINNGVASDWEKEEFSQIQSERALKSDDLKVIEHQDPRTGNMLAQIVSTKALLAGAGAEEYVIANIGKGGKLLMTPATRTKLTNEYMDLMAGIPILTKLVKDVTEKPSMLGFNQRVVNKALHWYTRLVDPEYKPEDNKVIWKGLAQYMKDAPAADKFYSEVEQFYQIEYRKPVTGAQAGLQELEKLRKEFLNKDLSPWQFIARATGIIQARRDKLARIAESLETGELPKLIFQTDAFSLDIENAVRSELGLKLRGREGGEEE